MRDRISAGSAGGRRRKQASFSACGAALLALCVALGTASSARAQQLYSIGSPTNDQQFMLEVINRARANGRAEATRLGLSGLQEGPPNYNGEVWTIENSVQPLSWNPLLFDSAQKHATRLNDADHFFLGVSPHTFGGTTPEERIAAAGYASAPYTGPATSPSGFIPGVENVAEAVSQGSGPFAGARLTAAVLDAHDNLFKDNDGFTPSRGHRNTTMLGFFKEIGIGISVGTDNEANPGQPNGPWESFYTVQNYGSRGTQAFLTGVVYSDANGNGFYDPGEGVGGVRVDVGNANFYAETASSGGYSVPVPGNGAYTIDFSGGSLPAVQRKATVTNNLNVKVDYVVTPAATPARLANISTRLRVETGENVLIGGFIITGTAPKKIMIRAIGPSLNLAGKLGNPTLELRDTNGGLLEANDDWQNSSNKQAIIDSTIPPTHDLESAIVRTVPAGGANYTAILRGVNNTTGVGLVEVYDLALGADSKLANISTRGLVQTGADVMIGGFIVLNGAQKVIVRAIGPSLPVTGKLADPTLELRDRNGALLAQNDNWRSTQEAEIKATTIPPSNNLESAIVRTLPPADYTAIVRGVNGTTGVALVEVYGLD